MCAGVNDAVSLQADLVAVAALMHSENAPANPAVRCKNGKKQQKKPIVKPSSGTRGVLTAADMYEPGFRIRNSGLCTERTQLLVLITSAAAPTHFQYRQAIRMTWMNRYGPSVTMAFLVGTPQMSETDPMAKQLKAEETAIHTRLNKIKYNNKTNKNTKFKVPADGDANSPRRYRFLRDRELRLGEGLDAWSMHGLNEAERTVQRVLGREHGRYGDLVQCQSRDTYTNLTLKSIAALEWIREYCPTARYLLKTDDDMFIDIRRLLRFIDKVETEAAASTSASGTHPIPPINVDPNETFDTDDDKFESSYSPRYDIELSPTIWGRLAHGWRPIRQHNSKYYVSRAQYAGRVYPDFCTGPAYLMTRSAVIPLYEGALGRDFDVMDEDDDDNDEEQYNDDDDDDDFNEIDSKDCGDSNETSVAQDDGKAAATTVKDTGKNTVPYLKLEDVYLTGVVAERLTRQAAERQARRERKNKEKISTGGGGGKHNQKTIVKSDRENLRTGKKNKLKADDIIVKVRRVHDEQFANKKITGRALERAVCNGETSGDNTATSGSGSFSWLHWYWGDTAVEKDLKKKKKDQGIISLHMVKFFEQFDLWRRLMDGRTKCKP